MRKFFTALFALVIFAAGFGLGALGFFPLPNPFRKPALDRPVVTAAPPKTYEQGYQAGLDFAKKRLAEEASFLSRSESIQDLRATVKTVESQGFTVEFKASLVDFFKEGMLTKDVTVSNQTTLERHVAKPMDQVSKEFADYGKAYQQYTKQVRSSAEPSTLKPPEKPLAYTAEKIELADLKPGDTVFIHSDAPLGSTDSLVAATVIHEQAVDPSLTPTPETSARNP